MPLLNQIVDNMSNMANLPRNINYTYFDEDDGFVKSMSGSRQFPSSIGLDIRVFNESGSTAKFALDGVAFDVLDGTSRTLSNVPYDKFEITVAGATTNKITVTVYGITMLQARRFSNFKGIPNDSVWGSA
tara:strand:+ start:181 stop:570 length:390 start_codon:yes stop_codon:yes gene_type:complete